MVLASKSLALGRCRQQIIFQKADRRWKSSNTVASLARSLLKGLYVEDGVRPDPKVADAGLFLRAEPLVETSRNRVVDRLSKLKNYVDTSELVPSLLTEKFQRDDEDASTIAGIHDPLDEWFLDRPLVGLLSSLPRNVTPLEEGADPFQLVRTDLKLVTDGIRRDLIGTDHPVLNQAASYFFDEDAGGKKVRPLIVLLLSQALAMPTDNVFTSEQRNNILLSQQRLAQIAEMIHTASLFHDDVIDNAETRRNKPTVHRIFGDKMAILAGDYLLARASIHLARLRHPDVIETMSTIVEHLVRGEVMQMKQPVIPSTTKSSLTPHMESYLRKNFYKTASLMANSCKSTALLGQHSQEVIHASYLYGKHFGIAFQLIDDIMDFDSQNAKAIGKPTLSDLRSGVATAPVLFATEEFPQLQTLVQRKFSHEGDVEEAVLLIEQSRGIERSKELAAVHSELAIEAMLNLKDNVFRDSLIHLACKMAERTR